MKENKVSVVMCTYNGETYLRQQLDSILAQTHPIAEFLIFDDASTDGTWQILEAYAAANPAISIHKNTQNIGFAANFSQALFAAKNNIIAVADQDDVWATNKIEVMLSAWRPESLLIYCDSMRFSNTLPDNPVPNPSYRRFEGSIATKLFLFNTVSGHAILFKKELLALAPPFSTNIYYDWLLAVVAAYNGGVDYVPRTLVFQRVHEKNVSVGNGVDHTLKAQRNAFKKMVITHLKAFATIGNMPDNDKQFAEEFLALLQKSLSVKFHFPLYLFMVKYRKILFNHKKSGLFSLIKHSYRLTYNYRL